jgi:beta-glucosidase-like glycosyl hydrolase
MEVWYEGFVCFRAEITPEEAEVLAAGVSGVILFNRNYVNAMQLSQLTRSLKERAGRPFLIGVNQPGY